jgi:hypothetical protein
VLSLTLTPVPNLGQEFGPFIGLGAKAMKRRKHEKSPQVTLGLTLALTLAPALALALALAQAHTHTHTQTQTLPLPLPLALTTSTAGGLPGQVRGDAAAAGPRERAGGPRQPPPDQRPHRLPAARGR